MLPNRSSYGGGWSIGSMVVGLIMWVCLICHSALAIFAIIKVTVEFDISSRKTLLLWVSYILQRSATTLSNLIAGVDALKLDNLFWTLTKKLEGTVTKTQLRWFCASLYTSCATWHWRNRCSTSLVLTLHRGQIKSIYSPLFKSFSLGERDAWHI